jgi:hypothetical protein
MPGPANRIDADASSTRYVVCQSDKNLDVDLDVNLNINATLDLDVDEIRSFS